MILIVQDHMATLRMAVIFNNVIIYWGPFKNYLMLNLTLKFLEPQAIVYNNRFNNSRNNKMMDLTPLSVT